MEEQKLKKKFYKRWWFWVIAVFVIFIIIGSTGSPTNNTQKNEPKSEKQTAVQPEPVKQAEVIQAETNQNTQNQDKEKAQKELDEIINLGKKAGLITSYEFSNKASVVYVGKVWYTQTVSFKKDLLAKIGTLKKQITGYQHFEVRDAYSNEKVAEITAFSGSLEVYK